MSTMNGVPVHVGVLSDNSVAVLFRHDGKPSDVATVSFQCKDYFEAHDLADMWRGFIEMASDWEDMEDEDEDEDS